MVDGNSGARLDFWDFLINEAAQHGDGNEIFWLFMRMRMEKIGPSSVVVINLLRSSVDLDSLSVGKGVHCLVT